jgi:hypothetical protein
MTMAMTADQPVVTAPSAADLLLAWEWGIPADAAERSVVLLAALLPEAPADRITSMTVGERDLHLLHARRMLFGPQLECVVSCPDCSVELELGIALGDLLERAGAPADGADAGEPGEVEADGWRVCFRLIELQDLIDAAPSHDPRRARQVLLQRCVLEAVQPDGRTARLPDTGVPQAVEHAVLEEMQRRDRMRPLDFQLTCGDCKHVWLAPFDILGFLWAEIEGWAHRTLREVHLLATAYGWRERDILELSAWRREAYLQLSGHA